MPRSRTGWKQIGLLIALTALAQIGTRAEAKERLEQQLAAPGGTSASGRARVILRSDSDGRLILSARGLAPNQDFDVIVGGVKVGTLHTTGGGHGTLRFRTRPRGHDLMLGFDPRGATITLRNADGVDVLTGTIPTGNSDPNDDKLVCCVPDDRGTECEDRTADECVARGGSVATATSCMPNPCEGAPPPPNGDIICCIPDDKGAECEDRTQAECAERGGVSVTATSCSPNPCAAVPPADPDIQCCLPDDSGSECEDRTAAECDAQGGVNMGPGTCSPDPCAVVPPANPDIRCCVPDDSGAECEDRTADECTARGGVNIGAGVCSADACAGVIPTTAASSYYSIGDDRGGGGGGGSGGGSGRGGHDDRAGDDHGGDR